MNNFTQVDLTQGRNGAIKKKRRSTSSQNSFNMK